MNRIMILVLSVAVGFSISCSKKAEIRSRAVITFAIGEAQVFVNNAWKGADTGMELAQGSKVRTGPGGTMDIQLGTSLVRVKEKSEMTLASLFMDGSTGLENTSVELAVGTMFAKPKKLLKGESFTVKTPTAVAGVRGTMFTVETGPGKDTRVEVVNGKVLVSKRIVALENIENEAVRDSELIKKLEAQVEESSVTVTENKAVKVDAKEVARANAQAEKVVEAVAAVEEKKAEAPPAEVEKAVEQIAAIQAIKADKVRNKKALQKEFEEIKAVEKKSPAEEKAVEKGRIELSVMPESARVFLNGEMAGSGNISVDMPVGTYALRIQADGYEEFGKDVVLASGRPVKEKIKLARLRPLDRVRWNLDVKSIVRGMVYSGDRVFVATGEGLLISFERKNAAKAWEKQTGLVTSGIAYDNKALYFATADEKFNALSMKTGEALWSKKLDGVVIDTITPVVTPGAVYIATARGVVYSYSLKGELNWKFDAASGVFETPILVNNQLLISSADGKLYSLAVQTGEEQWTADQGAKFRLAFNKGKLYAVGYYGAVSALQLENGTALWKKELSDTFVSVPVVSENGIVVAGLKGAVTWLDLENGNTLARKELGGPVKNSMVLSGGVLYVSANDTLFAMDAVGGGIQWKHQAPGRISTAASVVGNEVYVGLENGRVVSLNRNLERVRR